MEIKQNRKQEEVGKDIRYGQKTTNNTVFKELRIYLKYKMDLFCLKRSEARREMRSKSNNLDYLGNEITAWPHLLKL